MLQDLCVFLLFYVRENKERSWGNPSTLLDVTFKFRQRQQRYSRYFFFDVLIKVLQKVLYKSHIKSLIFILIFLMALNLSFTCHFDDIKNSRDKNDATIMFNIIL